MSTSSDLHKLHTANKADLNKAMERLISVVQQLSMARSMDTIMAIVRKEARKLARSDGATFVLRRNGFCYYADEDAITPLWKGKMFPMEACVSGWVMLNKKSAIIRDIYLDPRVPIDAYKTTFVKSIAMVPIRSHDPIGAIKGRSYLGRMTHSTESMSNLIEDTLFHIT